MDIKRRIEDKVMEWAQKGKIILLYGPRQVGKTTLVKKILSTVQGRYINCEIRENQRVLETGDLARIKTFLGDGDFFIFDEAQKVTNIGLVLKLLKDTYPELKMIATGSSSFDLANKTSEPLTGRAFEFKLYPISYQELVSKKESWERAAMLESLLIFGAYPAVVTNNWSDAPLFLDNLSTQYLFKDVFEFETLKKPKLLMSLLQLLALQLGSEVSLNELANKLETTRKTVERYLDLLEKCFVIFPLYPLSRNPRREIGRKNKIYFYDLGVRNSLISRFTPLKLREDVGALWENFCIVERKKLLNNELIYRNQFFWRDVRTGEVDYVEEYDGAIHGYEFKWGKKSARPPKNFIETYKASYATVNKENFVDFVTKK